MLAEPAEVKIKIYDVSGKLIKNLDMGRCQAGIYTTRDTAAYWDGRNEAGETVASGVYFYTLQAGEFSATRKMVLWK